MIDSSGATLIGNGKREETGMQKPLRSHCLKIPRFTPVRCRGCAFPTICAPRLRRRYSLALSLSRWSPTPPLAVAGWLCFFGSFEVGNQLDCLSTPEKSPRTLPSVQSFSCSPSLLLRYTLAHGHATTLFLVYALSANDFVYTFRTPAPPNVVTFFSRTATRRPQPPLPRFSLFLAPPESLLSSPG